METLTNIDMILFICLFLAVLVLGLLLVHAIGLLWLWWSNRWERKTAHTVTPWFRRVR